MPLRGSVAFFVTMIQEPGERPMKKPTQEKLSLTGLGFRVWGLGLVKASRV